MALFGVPDALEDGPLRACRAALGIHERLAEAPLQPRPGAALRVIDVVAEPGMGQQAAVVLEQHDALLGRFAGEATVGFAADEPYRTAPGRLGGPVCLSACRAALKPGLPHFSC